MRWSNLLRDLPPRGARPDPRPAHAVHDLRAADPALSDAGDRHRPVRRGARAEAAGRRRGRAPSTCPRRPPLLNRRRRRLQPEPLRFAGRGRAAGRAAGAAHRARGATRPCASRRSDPGEASAVMIDPARPARAAPRERRDRHPDPVQQRRRAQPDHLPAAQGGARSLAEEHRRRPAQARPEARELHRADPGQGRGRGHRAARWAAASGAGSSRSCW